MSVLVPGVCANGCIYESISVRLYLLLVVCDCMGTCNTPPFGSQTICRPASYGLARIAMSGLSKCYLWAASNIFYGFVSNSRMIFGLQFLLQMPDKIVLPLVAD